MKKLLGPVWLLTISYKLLLDIKISVTVLAAIVSHAHSVLNSSFVQAYRICDVDFTRTASRRFYTCN